MWGRLVLESLVRPRAAARQVLSLGLPVGPLIQAALAVTCSGVVLGYLALLAGAGQGDPVSRAVLGNPLIGAAAQLGVMALVALLTLRIGRAFGGTGDLAGTLALVVWLNAVLVAIQLVQLGALLVLPPLASLISLATIFWLIWAFTGFVTELHGFKHGILVLAGVVLAMVLTLLAIAIFLAIIGIPPRETL